MIVFICILATLTVLVGVSLLIISVEIGQPFFRQTTHNRVVKGTAVITRSVRRQVNRATTVPSNSGPYGFTVSQFGPQTVADLKRLGVTWVRYQLNWYKIEMLPGQFDWSELDTAVALANASNIHITFPLQDAPEWALSQTCQGKPFLPSSGTFAAFASAVAQRYNGQNGHGYIDSYEVGNEEFDTMWAGTWDKSIPCRQPSFYGPILKEVNQAIKAQSPHALIGMFGLLWKNTDHIRSYIQGLYDQGYGTYFDFANFHYYRCGAVEGSSDPSITSPGSYPNSEYPSFDLEWQIMHDVMVKNGDANKPIWVTETGWATNGLYQSAQCVVTPDQQAQYIAYVTKAAMSSHVVQHVFWYTLDEADGMSITQSNGTPLPSFYTIQAMVRHNPRWSE